MIRQRLHDEVRLTIPPKADSPRKQPSHAVFIGEFQLWAKPRLPPGVAPVTPAVINPTDSGSIAVVVAESTPAAGHAANWPELGCRHHFLPGWFLALERTLSVVVDGVFVQDDTHFTMMEVRDDGLQTVQQMQQLRPLMIACVRLCPLSEVSRQTGIAA